MVKKNKNPLEIFMESLKLYFSNFDKFIQYMTFPVLGQIAGLGLVFLITYFYTQNLPNIISKYEALNNFNTLILLSIIITLPGLSIFIKAFWDYLVAYGAVNSMLDNMLKSGRVYDFEAHREVVKRRTVPFVGLWFLFGFFSILALCPLLWVICGILAVYFVLVFQVFTYEPEQSPIGCVKRSLGLIKGHFASTFILMALVGALTYILVPHLFNKLFEISGVNNFLSGLILPLIKDLPELDFSKFGLQTIAKPDIALFTIQTFVAQILIQYTLPLRSILWSMWYKELSKNSKSTEISTKKSSKKRPSEKLMEASRKKYSKKKIDPNILKRAAEKDDE